MANQLYVRTTLTIARALSIGLASSGRYLVAVDENGLADLTPEMRDALTPYCTEYGPDREREAWISCSAPTLDIFARPSWPTVIEALRISLINASIDLCARREARDAATKEVLATDPSVERMPACVGVACGVKYVHHIEDGGTAAQNTDIRVIAWIDAWRAAKASRVAATKAAQAAALIALEAAQPGAVLDHDGRPYAYHVRLSESSVVVPSSLAAELEPWLREAGPARAAAVAEQRALAEREAEMKAIAERAATSALIAWASNRVSDVRRGADAGYDMTLAAEAELDRVIASAIGLEGDLSDALVHDLVDLEERKSPSVAALDVADRVEMAARHLASELPEWITVKVGRISRLTESCGCEDDCDHRDGKFRRTVVPVTVRGLPRVPEYTFAVPVE